MAAWMTTRTCWPAAGSTAWASVPCSYRAPACSGHHATASRRWTSCARRSHAGVDHIDTAQFYGPDVANELIHEALHPYPEALVLVSKVGARRDATGGWRGAQRPEELREGVLANLASLQVDQVPVVNLRRHPESDVPFDEQVAAMVAIRDEGLIGAVGLSNVTLEQYRSASAVTEVACVQNAYNLADRSDQQVLRRLRGRRRALRAVLPARLRLSSRPSGAGGAERRRHRHPAGRDPGPGGPGLAPAAVPKRAPDPGHVLVRAPAGEPGRGRPGTRRPGPGANRLIFLWRRTWPSVKSDAPDRSLRWPPGRGPMPSHGGPPA